MSVALPARLHRINGIDMVIVALLAVLVAVSAQMALAQGVTIAAIVNDEIISAYDVEQRVLLITRSSRLPDTAERRRGLRPSMVRRLINEALQRQEAKKRNIVSDEADLSRAHQILEQNNRLAEGQFKSFIRNMGVDIEVLNNKLHAEILWAKLIASRLKKRAEATEDDVDEVVQRLEEDRGGGEYLVSEILLLRVAEESGAALRRARILAEQLQNGAAFNVLARQFSQGPTAPRGGEVGWVRSSQMLDELLREVAKMRPGSVSSPIDTDEGVYLVFLHKSRQIGSANLDAATVAVRQINFEVPPSPTTADLRHLKQIGTELQNLPNGCQDLGSIAKAYTGASAVDLGQIKIGDLPEELRTLLLEAEIGRFQKPVFREDRMLVLLVCARQVPPPAEIDRRKVAERLTQKRLNLLAIRYLADLRRSAAIEIR